MQAAATRANAEVVEVGPGRSADELAAAAPAVTLVAAGGDGTVNAVASVAIERDLPLVVLPCGTRNHFASDAGLPVEDPLDGLSVLDDGVETGIDVGDVNGRLFLNNASIGFYSTMIQDPAYRKHRIVVPLRYLRRTLFGGGRTVALTMSDPPPRVKVPANVLTVLVSNNEYSPAIAPGPALRPRLDGGQLWVHVIGSDRRGRVTGWTRRAHRGRSDRRSPTGRRLAHRRPVDRRQQSQHRRGHRR